MDIVDRIAVMDYRDFAFVRNATTFPVNNGRTDGMVNLAAGEIAYANAVNKTVIIIAETLCSLDPQYISFCEEGSTYFEQEIAKVYEHFKDEPSFGGLGVHQRPAWNNLAPAYTISRNCSNIGKLSSFLKS